MLNQNPLSPAKHDKELFPVFQTPKKPQWMDLSQKTDFATNNLFTPPQKVTQTISTNYHTSPFQVQQSPWKTPTQVLKQQNHHDSQNNTPISPFSDRYIPFRPNNVSKNLFQESDLKAPKVSQFDDQENFENENKKTYTQLLQQNMFQQESVLNFKPKQQQQQSPFPEEQKLNKTPNKRKIDHTPFKVLDAPGLEDDYYQDTLDWGKSNLIAVGLQRSIFLYNFFNGRVFKAIDQSVSQESDSGHYTSVKWNNNGQLLGVGTYDGNLLFWDVGKQTVIRQCKIGQKRLGTIDWCNNNVFGCGSKEKCVMLCDYRQPKLLVEKLNQGHNQEVCGVSFSDNENNLASGGNDNRVIIWDMRRMQLQWMIKEHKAAVRAIGWNPNASGVLATGGGNSDKTIKIFSTLTNSQLQSINVDSQVCKLRFSRTTNELVSSHGYEHNQINLWDYSTMRKIGQLEGHQNRVLYLSMSPDESSLVSGAGDETLKFWKVFPGIKEQKKNELLNIIDIR